MAKIEKLSTIPEEVLEMIRKDMEGWAVLAEKVILARRIESVIQDERGWIESALELPEFSKNEK